MKTRTLYLLGALFALFGAGGCQDEMSGIGSSLSKGEVAITADSLEVALATAVEYESSIDGRNAVKLLGRINVPEYGSLSCSFVTQMLSAQTMNIPDSITEADIDSMRLVLTVPRGSLTGDSLAPQQLKVYRLNRDLPASITSGFDPAGYYDTNPVGQAIYTLSNIARGDSALKNDPYVRMRVHMPKDFALQLFRMYRNGDPVFQWPSTFNKFFPGLYVAQTFGNGCIANVSKAQVYTYWHYPKTTYEEQPDSTFAYVTRTMRDSVCLLASQPEVLSSNIINFRMSDYLKGLADSGHALVTSPGGYRTKVVFPVQRLIDQYRNGNTSLSMVSALRLDIPAEEVHNDHGLTVSPWLLMVKSDKLEEFFSENKVPDGKTSFYAAFDAETGSYSFKSMRSYFLDILERVEKGDTINASDTEFTLLPVNITTETVENYSSTAVYVTSCQPYLLKPTMTKLDTQKAKVSFTYSTQIVD